MAFTALVKITANILILFVHVLVLKELHLIFSHQELVSDPKFIVDDVSRFDYAQGSVLGKFQLFTYWYHMLCLLYNISWAIIVLHPISTHINSNWHYAQYDVK